MNNRTIIINGKEFNFEEVELYQGRKTINKEIAKENLLLLYPILEKSKVRYGLFYGTLLGAIRENDFIAHDEDVDLYLLTEDKDSLLKFIYEIEDTGLKLIRYKSHLMSFMRNNEYIDIYFYSRKKHLFLINVRKLANKHQVRAHHLEHPVKYNFLGEDFNVPNNPEKVLNKLYGKNWRTPIKNYRAPYNTIYEIVKRLIPGKILLYLKKLKSFLSADN